MDRIIAALIGAALAAIAVFGGVGALTSAGESQAANADTIVYSDQ